MSYRYLIILLISLIFGAVSTASFAESAQSQTDDTKLIEQEISQNQVLAHKMMGHINLAKLALELNLTDEASNQLSRAQDIKTNLMQQMPQLKLTSSFKYGKVTHEDETIVTEHYIPIVDDVFLVSEYEEIFKQGKEADVDETAAAIVHVGISVDLQEVDKALTEATAAIGEEDYSKAQKALDDVFKGAIYEEEEVNDPKLAIAENIALARTFIDHGRFESARLTLGHIQNRLNRDKNSELSSVDQASLDEFSASLDKIRRDLREKDPTSAQQISHQLSNWGDAIRSWFD